MGTVWLPFILVREGIREEEGQDIESGESLAPIHPSKRRYKGGRGPGY